MKQKYTKWSKETLEPIVASSISLAECLRKMNLLVKGGNYGTIKRKIQEYSFDTSHFLGQAHNLNKEIKTFDDLKKPENIKKRLIQERGHQCQNCLNETWNSLPIALELEHNDGNRNNNSRENLKLLCPNCHAQTPTWRRRKSSLSL